MTIDEGAGAREAGGGGALWAAGAAAVGALLAGLVLQGRWTPWFFVPFVLVVAVLVLLLRRRVLTGRDERRSGLFIGGLAGSAGFLVLTFTVVPLIWVRRQDYPAAVWVGAAVAVAVPMFVVAWRIAWLRGDVDPVHRDAPGPG